MMASSTSRPSASTSVPSDTLCKPIPNTSMNRAVTASTTGIEISTTMPVRSPSDTRLTISTMATASATDRRKSSTECETACGMLDTSVKVRPAGNWAFSFSKVVPNDLPRRTTSCPGCMVMPMPSTGAPPARICATGGSS
ncbi:hypothetical protein G6F68_013952 [Rhizopus microsporus]|nr:hypothetical protein G6F68_013952 [Rhizopus microsporus]